jgi:transcriptional regulator with XRE-family HTH domain
MSAYRHTDPIVDALAAERCRRGLTLLQVGELLGRASYNTVWQWENGKNQPKLANVRAWADVLGYDLALVPREERT